MKRIACAEDLDVLEGDQERVVARVSNASACVFREARKVLLPDAVFENARIDLQRGKSADLHDRIAVPSNREGTRPRI